MLYHTQLLKLYLGEVIMIANYLQNRSPIKVFKNNKTLIEMWI